MSKALVKSVKQDKDWNFPVEEKEITLIGNRGKNGEAQVWNFDPEESGLDKYKAIVRPDTNSLVSIVSNRYELVTNQAVVDAAEEALSSMPDMKNRKTHTFTFNNGAVFERRYTFPDLNISMGKLSDDEKDKLVTDEDLINPTLSFFNSYNGWKSISFVVGAYRLVCKNGLMTKQGVYQMSRKHQGDIDTDFLKENVKKAIDHFYAMRDEWNEWKKEPVTENVEDLLEENVKYVGKKYQRMIKEEWEKKILKEEATKWLLFNVVTRIITHEVKTRSRQVRMQASFNKLFYSK